MSEKLVTLTIEGIEVSVPQGTLIVDAAKQVGVYVPVFCYHPKLDPVGMCRMCLVEIGRPRRDRETGDFARDERGEPIVEFAPNPETACTTQVGEGWVVRATSERALAGQKEVVEYLLTSHPLDCPICDKGGECPLQELTMDFGAGKSRFLYEDKIHLAKAVPLGELIYLDRERCIQCARCVRFQEEIVGDPVLSFEQRGRRLQIVTYSDPGFDSYFSGNTTDVCPVGALTTADFRFEARPWELKAAASICSHCPVGCNTVLNTRRQAKAGGHIEVQRVMPRQHEAVNEIWLCDKGRFAHHYAGSRERLRVPLLREEDELKQVAWEEALKNGADGLKAAGGSVVGLASGRASNEDLFHFRSLVEGLGGQAFLYDAMGGGDAVQKVGMAPGSNLAALGKGDAILVVAADLHEEAPIWWLRVKQAAERGAALIVIAARPTRLDAYAQQQIRTPYGDTVRTLLSVAHAARGRKDRAGSAQGDLKAAAKTLAEAENLVVFYGAEGLDTAGSTALAQACAALLVETGHSGKVHNGLIPVWPRANTQGAWELGLRPADDLAGALGAAEAVVLLAADPAGDEAALAAALEEVPFVVALELFETPSVRQADVVLPAQSYIEREGTFTSGERRVQRFFPAVPALGETRPDWRILAELGARLGIELERKSPALVMRRISESLSAFEGISYQGLSRIEAQWPAVGGEDLYFGGTAYANVQGLGIQLALAGGGSEGSVEGAEAGTAAARKGDLLLVPIVRLYDRGRTVMASDVLHPRLASAELILHPEDAERLNAVDGIELELGWDGGKIRAPVRVSAVAPAGAVLAPRSMGFQVPRPVMVEARVPVLQDG